MQEEWRPIKGYEGYYEVSNLGKVRSCERTIINHRKEGITKSRIKEKIMTNLNHNGGYYFVVLSKERNIKRQLLHRIVAMAFLPNPDNLPEVNHKDGNKKNNCVDNLEWVTRTENAIHAWEHGLNSWQKRVIMMKDGVAIKEFRSATEAARQLGVKTASAISNVACGNRKHAYGYEWKFKEKEPE